MRVVHVTRKALFSLGGAAAVLLLAGCARTFIFNGVPFPDPVSATAAAEAHFSGIEKSIASSDKQLPLDLMIVIPSRLYARTHWIRVTGNRAALGEDQMQYLANIQVRDAEHVARCVKNAAAFRTVTIVNALPATLEPSPSDLKSEADLIMKRLPSGHWALGAFPAGPFAQVAMPTGLKGTALLNAIVLAVRDQAEKVQHAR